MTFSKTFPRKVSDNAPPVWEEITLDAQEEMAIEESARKINFQILDQCLHEAKMLAIKHGINSEENQTRLAISLFEKRASHQVFWKENKAKEKFDTTFKS